MLPKFAALGLFNITKFQCDEADLGATFLSKNAVYHKNCFSKYDQYHYDRQPQRKVEDLTDLIVPILKVTIPVQRDVKEVVFPWVRLFATFVVKHDTSSNLCAAGILHAKCEKVNKQHVEELTLKLKTMAALLGENALLAKLSTGDIVANELYYHKKCYNAFLNKLNQKKTNDEYREYFNLKENEDFI